MMRSFAVVLVFMGLNALGFVAYRGRATPGPATSIRADAGAGMAATFSRANPASQPKPIAPARSAVVAPPTSSPADHAFTHVPESTVTGHTNAEVADPAPDEAGATAPDRATGETSAPAGDRHAHHRPPAHRRIEHAAPPAAKPAHEVAHTVEDRSSEPDRGAKDKARDKYKPKDADKLLEMEANPYKQRE